MEHCLRYFENTTIPSTYNNNIKRRQLLCYDDFISASAMGCETQAFLMLMRESSTYR
jgi:hypothetical protein